MTTKYQVKSGVAVVTICNPPMNSLAPVVLKSLFESMRKAHQDPSVEAVVLIGEGQNFSAGFDITEFKKMIGGAKIEGYSSQATTDGITQLIEYGPKPTVCALSGNTLGGGCEIAIGCNARVAINKLQLGLPELKLGIIPGFGGTQRLPRLVGLKKGIEMMLQSQIINGEAALKIGLVDEIAEPSLLLEKAIERARAIAHGKLPRLQTLSRTDKIETYAIASAIFSVAKQQAKKTAKNMTHPLLCIDAIKFGIDNGGLKGLSKEQEIFAKCQELDVHKGLIHVFFAQRDTKRIKGVTDKGLKARKMSRVGVLGGGLMGAGIACTLLAAGYEVIVKEINEELVAKGVKTVKANMESLLRKKKVSQKIYDEAVNSKLKGQTDYKDFNKLDMVIEAVIENLNLKQNIFKDLESVCSKDCILSTNTSTIDITLIGKKTNSVDRIVGAHFFSPAQIMPLLEIVRSDYSSPQVILDTLQLSTSIKKTPVLAGNCTGFAVNRVFFPYHQAANLLLECKTNPYLLDKTVFEFGMPMGPFRLADLVGWDVNYHVGKNFLESYPDRCYNNGLTETCFQKKMLGEKTGSGAYSFDAKRNAKPNPQFLEAIQELQRKSKLATRGVDCSKTSPQELIEILFFPVINEGCRIIQEGIVDKPSDLDIATIMGMGFPAYRGGIIFFGDLCGASYVVKKLNHFKNVFGQELHQFFEPCAYLAEAAKSDKKLEGGNTKSRL